jgi:hypothetical protein
MHAYEYIRCPADVSADKRHMFSGNHLSARMMPARIMRTAKNVRFEFAVTCRDLGFRETFGEKVMRPDHPSGDVHLNSVAFL